MSAGTVFDGTRVRRELVHRAHEQEVLVSPPWQTAGGGFGGATATAAIGPYYRDHPRTHWLDVLLLIEACRQTALSAAHEFEGLSSDIAFFFNSIDLEITDLESLAGVGGELTIGTVFQQLRLRGDGSPKQIEYTQQGSDGSDRPVLRTSMAVQGVPKGRYRELRAYQRNGSAPPTTEGLRSDPARRAGLSAPEQVARKLATHVVLADVRAEAGGVTAALAPDFANASLFDHDYDHYPAMVLIEAGRQLALHGTGRPAGHVVTAVRATFAHFAELDRETRIVAEQPAVSGGERWVDAECVQDGLAVTRMSFRVTPVGPEGSTR